MFGYAAGAAAGDDGGAGALGAGFPVVGAVAGELLVVGGEDEGGARVEYG